jgi:hypothetical protein
VKTALKCDDFVPLLGERMKSHQFYSGFVRFGTAVAEEHFSAETSFGQEFRPRALQFGVPSVGNVNQFGDLFLYSLDNRRGSVSEESASPAGKEVDVPFSFGIPDFGVFSAYQRYRIARVVADDVLIE